MQAGLMTKTKKHSILRQFDGASLLLQKISGNEYNAKLLSDKRKILAVFHVSGDLYDTWAGFVYNGDDFDMNIYNGRDFLGVDVDYAVSIYPVHDGNTDTSMCITMFRVEVI